MASPSIPEIAREYRMAQLTGFHDLTLTERPVPKSKENEVLVKVYAVSINYRDLVVARGGSPLPTKGDVIPCSDMAGLVVSSSHSKFKVGDRVAANFALDHVAGTPTPDTKATVLFAEVDGVLAEYRSFPGHALVYIPEHLSYEEGATLPCAAVTAYNALTGSIPIKAGDTVLIQGTGGVSIFGLQFAVASGATVIASSSSQDKLDFLKSLGATHVLNYKNNKEWSKKVLELTGGEGVDHVLEVGGPGTWLQSAQCTKYGGEIHVIGALAPLTDVKMMFMHLIQRSLHMHGVQTGSVTQFKSMNRLISAAGIRPIVNKVFEFEQAREAFEYMAAGSHLGKVIIRVAKD